ncbi:MAG TPA: flagellar export chaperone FliS [Bryobacteraceae bacterium]|nr:flagellar export chaperone FliS [Bryobacteraceae bacterium]
MASNQGKREYIAHRVLTASPVELIHILYQSAVQAVDEAVVALHSGDILSRGCAITKAIEILSELRASLRRDVQEEYSNTLEELYDYMQRQLIRAHREQSEALLLEVGRLLNTLLEGWAGAMNNTSPVNHLDHGAPAERVSVASPYLSQAASSSSDCRSWQF